MEILKRDSFLQKFFDKTTLKCNNIKTVNSKGLALEDLPKHLQPDLETAFGPQAKAPIPKELPSSKDIETIEALLASAKGLSETASSHSMPSLPEPTESYAVPASSPEEDSLFAHLEVSYWVAGGYPSLKELTEETYWPESRLRQMISRVNPRLTLNGLPQFTLPRPVGENSAFKGWTSKYDPRFVLSVNTVTNVSDKRSKAAKLAEINVSPAEWDGWLTNSENYEYYKFMVDVKWKQGDETAKLQLLNGMERGDLSTIKYWHEFTGKHVQRSELSVNTSVVISRVIEVLTSYVDPGKLTEIAQALQMDSLTEVSSTELFNLDD